MDPGTAGILVAEGAALAAVLAAYSLGRDATTTTTAGVPETKAASPPQPPGSAPGSAAASVTVPDSTEDPTIEALPDVSAAKKALQAKKRELEITKITRESDLNTKLDEGKPAAGAPGDQWKAWKAARALKEKELRLGFTHEDEDNATALKGLQKDVDDARAAAVTVKATQTTIPEQPNGVLTAETLAFKAAAAAAAARGEGKPGVESPPGLPLPTDLEKNDFTTAVDLAMAKKFEKLQPAIDLADKTPSLLAGTYGGEKDPFLVYFMKKLIHAAVQNKLRWSINVRTDRAEAKKYAEEKAVASTGRGRVRTPRRIRGGASTVEANTMILKTLNVLKDRGETDPKELTPIMTAFLLLVADYNGENLDIYNNLVDIFTTFIDYKGYADRWRTYLLRMNSPDRKLVANVMFATALKVTDVDALNPYFFWARSGLRNSWGDAVAAKPFTIDPAKLTERKKVTAQGKVDDDKQETLNPAAGAVLDRIKEADAAAKAAAETAPMKVAKAALTAAAAPAGAVPAPAPGAGEIENANAGAAAAAEQRAAAAEARAQEAAAARDKAATDQAAAEQRAAAAEQRAQEAAAARDQAATDQAAAVEAEKQRAATAAAAAQTAAVEAEKQRAGEAAAAAAGQAAAQAAAVAAAEERVRLEYQEKLNEAAAAIRQAQEEAARSALPGSGMPVASAPAALPSSGFSVAPGSAALHGELVPGLDYEHSSLRSESSNSVDPRGSTDSSSVDNSLVSVPFHVAGRGFGGAVDRVKKAVELVAHARNIPKPVPPDPVRKTAQTRSTNADQLAEIKKNQDALDKLRRDQQTERAKRMVERAKRNAVTPLPDVQIQAALDNANDVAAQAVQERRTSGIDPRIEGLNEELAFYLAWLTQQEAETGFVPTKQMANPPRRGGSRRKTPRRHNKKTRKSTFRRNRKH